MTLTIEEVKERERVICEAVLRDSTARSIQRSTRALLDIRESHNSLQIENEMLREALRENVGEAYNLITQGESPTARRQPSAQRIYDRSREALAQKEKP